MNALASKLYKRITNFILAFVVATGTLSIVGPYMSSASALSYTVVNPGDAAWSTSETRSNGAVNYVADANTPYGDGALQLITGAATGSPLQDKANTIHAITPTALSSVTGEISYWTKQVSASFSAGLPSFQIPVLLDGTAGSFTNLVYEPYVDQGNGAVLSNTWQKWTVSGAGKLWSSRNYGTIVASQGSTTYTIADVLALYPNAQVLGFGVNVGSNNPFWDTRVDGVTFNGDTYDFEPFAVPTCAAGDNTNFENFSNGSVNGQNGWESTGPFDQAVVTNNYGIESFGCKSLRISNSVTSGSFGDQTFSYSTANEAGEVDSTNGGKSGGIRQNHYEASFDIASTQNTVQTGLSVSVSPDRGDGSRMSYLRFVDGLNGIEIYFDDVQATGFEETYLGILSNRSVAHNIKFVIDYVDGPSNDIVKIYIDGVLKHEGTSWEDYYRFDPESVAEQTPRTSDSLIFRVGGTAAPATAGKGFLFDNVVITTSTIGEEEPEVPSNGGGNENGGSTTTTTTVTNIITPVITNPASVLGATDDTTANNDGSTDVEGTTDDKTATTDQGKDGVILGLAWYWWLLILAGATGLTWWLIAAYRRRNNEE